MNDNDLIKTKQLSIFEIVLISIRMYAKNIKYILPVCLAVFVPVHILMLFIPTDIFTVFLDPTIMLTSSQMDLIMKYLLVLVGIEVVFTPLCAGALSYITVQNIEGKPVGFAGIMESSLVKWGKLIYTAVLYYAIVLLSSFLIIPAIYFGVAFMFYVCIAAVSNKYGFSALLISRVLIRGRWLRGLLLGVLIYFASLLLAYAINGLFFSVIGLPVNTLTVFLSGTVADILKSFSFIAVCVFYINIHYNFKPKEQI